MRAWLKRQDRKLWWAFLIASIVVGAIRNPDCQTADKWYWWVLPFAIFAACFAWLHWTSRVEPRRRAARTGDVETYIKTAVRGKRIRFVWWDDTTVSIYLGRHGTINVSANVEWDGEPTDTEREVLDRLDVGAGLSVDLT